MTMNLKLNNSIEFSLNGNHNRSGNCDNFVLKKGCLKKRMMTSTNMNEIIVINNSIYIQQATNYTFPFTSGKSVHFTSY